MSSISSLSSNALLTPTSQSGSTSQNTNTAGITFSGLASGVDTQGLITGLLALDNAQVTTLQNQQAQIGTEQTTFKTLEADVLNLQLGLSQLSRSVGNPLDAKTTTVSDSTMLQAAAGGSATPGVYAFKITSLATAHQIASQGVAAGALLQTGTLQLQVGNGATTTVTVDNTNNTLQGLANAINNANGDVAASVVNDGTPGTPDHLMLTSKKTGQANQIQVTNNLNQGSGASLNLNPATQTTQAGANATIVMGSGANPLTINSATNAVNTRIPGVTLNLQNADPNKTVTLTVANDTTATTKTITDFVTSYNNIVDFITKQTSYDPQTKQAGLLLGNSDVNAMGNAMAQALGGVVSGVSSSANRLSAIGITFDDTGHLNVDSTKLNSALSGQLPGVTAADVRRLFALDGSSNSAGVSFVFGGTSTKASGQVGVKITQVATQATLTAANALTTPVTIDGTNDQLNLSVNGRSATISLAHNAGYTAASLAQEVQNEINGNTALGGAQVSVAVSNGSLQVQTAGYGSGTSVTVSGGSALSALGFTAGQSATGQNVAGHFLVNGKSEAATGSGQTLTGATGNANTDGLVVQVTLAASQLNGDPNTPEANVNVTHGLAANLNKVLSNYLDPVNGRFKTLDDGFNRQISDLQSSIDRQNALISAKHDSLVQQFADMESAVSQLQAIGTQITGQLAGLKF
jgi:flagellar hook-associated protein 2